MSLQGQRIVVTRSREQAGALGSKLAALGAEVIELPTIEIQPAADYGPLDRAIAELDTFDWLIFTSANGVRYFVERLDHSPRDLRALRAKICTIGPVTKECVEALHLKVDLIGTEYVAEGLIEALADCDLQGKRILLPRAAVARDVLPADLGDYIRRVRSLTTLPLSVGFGISKPDQARMVAAMVDGVVVGTALIRLYETDGFEAFKKLAISLREACVRKG